MNDVQEAIDKLKSAGFRIEYAYRPTSEFFGYLRPNDTHSYQGDDMYPYVYLGDIGSGEDALDQTSTLSRSNYRRLHEDYPDAWTDVSYQNQNSLGAFIIDLLNFDGLIDILIGLKNDYPVYDEEDMSELEQDEITASWDDYVSWDIRREFGVDVKDKWDELSDEDKESLFWTVVQENDDLQPEHGGLDIHWKLNEIAAKITEKMDERNSSDG